MRASHVVVRLPSEGTVIGESVARHPGSVVTCVLAGQHAHDGRPIVDHLALVEGLPDAEVASLLLGWARQHGEAPQALGGPFALRLPVALDAAHTPTVAACLRLAPEMPGVAQRLHGRVLELWVGCATPEEAERRRRRLEAASRGMPVLSIEVAEPPQADLECWDLLRSAAPGVVLDCLVEA